MRNRTARALALAGALLFLATGNARAQTQTNVTATITDPLGIPYAGTYSIQLVPTGTNPTVNGNSIGGAFNGTTDTNGKFNVSLWPNSAISPGGSQWQFTVCATPGVQPPLGTGGQCTPPTAITISGTSQNISATLNAVAPKLTTITIGAGSVTSVAATPPIVVTPNPIVGAGNVSCPTCQTSSSSSSALLPFGTDTGVANAYVVNPSPAVTLTAGYASCFSWTTTNASSGASTINVSGTGVKTLLTIRNGATGAGTILANTLYQACYDGTNWFLAGQGAATGSPLALGGMVDFLSQSTAGEFVAPALTLRSYNPPAGATTMLMFQDAGTTNSWGFDIDSDHELVMRSSGSGWTINVPVVWFNAFTMGENTNTGGTDIIINPAPGGAKISGNAISVQNNSGPVLFNIDSLTGRPSASGSACTSSASPAVCGGSWTGAVTIAAAATTVVVNTTAVTANSEIHLTEDSSQGTRLSVTCNTQSSLVLGTPRVTARTAGTSFTISIDAGPTTNPMCINYNITN
jgi:hypothetical protein